MSYQVLARKWRPATFEQMVGQSHVLHALTNALTQNRLHHAYLFSGTRGVGKTSLARLFAKGLNCEQGITATPCGTCSSCEEIAQGRFVDLIEVDAASRTKVDDTRELLDNVQYRPSRGRFKVYLIDEVHMLSRSSFNALLKTLEEPPEHVKFLLATTDPQRLPVTVLSRCLQFNLKSLTQNQIAEQLSTILSKENVSHDQTALNLLAKAANGSMRDALSLTDQAIAFGAGKVQLELVQTMLGSIDERYVISLLDGLMQGDIGQLMTLVNDVLSRGAQAEEVLRSLLELLHQITLTQFAPAAAQVSAYTTQIEHFAQQLNPEQVQLYYQLLLNGRRDLPHAADPKSGLEMALLRAIAFVPEKPVNRWLAQPHEGKSLPDAKPVISAESAVSLDSAEKIKHNEQAVTAKPVDLPLAATPSSNDAVNDRPTSSSAKDSIDVEQQTADGDNSSEFDSKNDDEIADAALLSEQALILSQAASQMGSQSAASSAQDKASLDTDERDSQHSTGQPSTHKEGTQQQSTHQQSTLQQSTQQPNNQLSAENELAAAQSLSAAEEARQQSLTDEQQIPLEHYEMQSAAMDDEPEEYYVEPPLFDTLAETAQSAPNQSSQSFDTTSAVETAKTAVRSPSSQRDNAEPSSGEVFDDPLDAVLAARQSLLTDLDAEPAKESDTKKPLAGKKAYVPPTRKPAADETNALGDSNETTEVETEVNRSQSIDKVQQDSETLPEKNTQAANKQLISADDRPPWEPAAPVNDSSLASQTGDIEAAETGQYHQTDEHALLATEQTSQAAQQALPATSDATGLVNAQGQASLPAVLPPLGEGEVTGNDIDLKWYRLMSVLEVGGRVRQLAVNSVCPQFSSPLSLLLKPNQKHLAAPVAVEQLQQALDKALGEHFEINIDVGVDSQRETPLEIRQRFHKELVAQADYSFQTDDNIKWLQQFMQVEMEPDTISYAPELMAVKGESIELINGSNFSRLTKS
ncbi:DNA polymerase III subunit gamma/tau [Shewanella waksmanii]|uniref:DNA polymerase III subunit gamma/tau n=1 Tax=Shewanella waksmanii TaxID=213783 RepID=UPI0037356D6A